MSSPSELKLSVPSVAVIAAVVGAAAFAIGRSTAPMPAPVAAVEVAPDVAPPTPRRAPPLPENASASELPAGHPTVTGADLPSAAPAAAAESSLSWTKPARWLEAPNASSMRIATYKIPHAPPDTQDPEMSVMQAGGTVDANVERWVGQFDPEGQKTAKRTTTKVGSLEVTIVEVEGTFAGGMGMGGSKSESGWALLGAIVATPDMPHFFKMTGPAKSVKAARAELDALVASLTLR